jgi:hypothetical protein
VNKVDEPHRGDWDRRQKLEVSVGKVASCLRLVLGVVADVVLDVDRQARVLRGGDRPIGMSAKRSGNVVQPPPSVVMSQ